MVLVLHGGKPRSAQAVDGRSASWRRAAWLRATSRSGRTTPGSASGWSATAGAAGTAAPTGRPTPAGRSTGCARSTATSPWSCSGTRWVPGGRARRRRPVRGRRRRPRAVVVGRGPGRTSRVAPCGRPTGAATGSRRSARPPATSSARAPSRTAPSCRTWARSATTCSPARARWHDVAIESVLEALGAHVLSTERGPSGASEVARRPSRQAHGPRRPRGRRRPPARRSG